MYILLYDSAPGISLKYKFYDLYTNTCSRWSINVEVALVTHGFLPCTYKSVDTDIAEYAPHTSILIESEEPINRTNYPELFI